MVKFSFILLFILLSCTAFSQSATSSYFSEQSLKDPQHYKSLYDQSFTYREIPVFNNTRYPDAVILENGYADYKIKNPEDWKNGQEKIPYQVDVVFTKYPWKKSDWLTNYYDLLAKRLAELFRLDPNLNTGDIQWNLVLQTNCKTAEETRSYFHGIVIRYRLKNEAETEIAQGQETIMDASKFYMKVTSFMDYLGGTNDATVYNALSRIDNASEAAVVMDWTGSMYVYSAQAILWHLKQLHSSGIKYFTFFNDGDRLLSTHKKVGETGGVYHAEANDFDSLFVLMEYVMKKGTGGDWPENDMEALLKTMEKFESVSEVYLIADNNSNIRDYSLLEKINKPVHVIVCGGEKIINVQYINLAYKTGGSIHTNTQDIENIGEELNSEGKFYVLNHRYKINENDEVVHCMDMDPYFFEERERSQGVSKKEKKKKKRKEPGCPEF